MGRVVLVTGSTSGIGEATALAFAARGHSVVFNSVSSVAAGGELAARTPGSVYLQGDVADADDCHRLIDATLGRFGRLDVLVNNAGRTRVIPHADIDAASVEVFREIFDVNVFGTWQLIQAALPALRHSRGSIVNITSVAGVRPTGSSIPYAASKAALNHLTVLLAKVVGPEVRVNAVAPGLIDTPWTADWDAIRGAVSAIAPLKRSGTPADVAEVILSLSDAAYVTGQVVVVDGGLTIAS